MLTKAKLKVPQWYLLWDREGYNIVQLVFFVICSQIYSYLVQEENQWLSKQIRTQKGYVCWEMFSNGLWQAKRKYLICSVCHFLWSKQSHHGQFKLPMDITNCVLGRNVDKHLVLVGTGSSTPLDMPYLDFTEIHTQSNCLETACDSI